MRHSFLFSPLLLLTLVVAGCKKADDKPSTDIVFGKDWYTVTQQADANGYLTYKLQGEFTPQGGAGINGFRLETTGAFVLHTQDPADAPLDVPGTWKSEDRQAYQIELTDGQRYRFIIKPVDKSTVQAKME